MPYSKAARLRQDLLLTVTDALRAWARGDDLDAAEVRLTLDARIDEEFADERREAAYDICLRDVERPDHPNTAQRSS